MALVTFYYISLEPKTVQVWCVMPQSCTWCSWAKGPCPDPAMLPSHVSTGNHNGPTAQGRLSREKSAVLTFELIYDSVKWQKKISDILANKQISGKLKQLLHYLRKSINLAMTTAENLSTSPTSNLLLGSSVFSTGSAEEPLEMQSLTLWNQGDPKIPHMDLVQRPWLWE